jgi:hypothetical protein
VEILRVSATITLRDLSVIEHYGNLKEVHLRRLGDSTVNEALSVFKRCTNLRRITFEGETRPPFLSSEELCDFIMELKHLTFLHIIYRDSFQCNHFKSLVDEVKVFALPRRPNFEFFVSCCAKFHQFRVRSEFFYK